MAWINIAPPLAPQKASQSAPVTLSASAPDGKVAQRLFLAMRPSLVKDLAWWVQDARVILSLGAGEHVGLLRADLARSGFRVRTPNGRSRSAEVPILLVSFPPAPGMPLIPKHRPEPVEFEYGDDWLEVTLPIWARPAEPPAQSASAAVAPAKPLPPAAPPARPAKQPFKGAGSTGPDPYGPAARRA